MISQKPPDIPGFLVPRTVFRRRGHVQQDISNSLKELHKSVDVGLHLGAGSSKIEGLLNCDQFDPNADEKIDAVSLRGFENDSVDLIEHHHMLEHLSFEQCEKALTEWFRVLKSGGYLVITFPDITRVCFHYLKLRAIDLLWDRSEELDYAIKMLVGSQEHEGMFHKNHFDRKRIKRILPAYGLEIVFIYPYPNRPTPSTIVVARKNGNLDRQP